jgi:DNA-binding beta-propeller fold protein YncE
MDDPEFIGEYQVVRRLGSGGMGEVYLVQHPRLPRQDALKLLDASVGWSQQFQSRFKREADLLAPLRHPNIVTVYDRGEFEGRLWLSMEYVPGGDAGQLLRERGPLPVDLVAGIVGGAGAGLDYAYSGWGITHRDVKPANILVDFDAAGALQVVKLADFGIAKADSGATALTSAGVTLGTMSYISPESIEGRTLDNRADLYSLACTAFQLLSGYPPYTGDTLAALMNAHLLQPVPSISERAPWLPAYLDGVFYRALAKEPAARFQSAAEFVAALRPPAPAVPRLDTRAVTVLRSEGAVMAAAPVAPVAAPTRPQGRGGKRGWAILLVVLLAFAALVTGAYLRLHDGQALPIDGLNAPSAVVVDAAGTVYVADTGNSRVVKLASGSSDMQAISLGGLRRPQGVAVDSGGTVYVADTDNKRVVSVSGDGRSMVLAFGELSYPVSVATDSADAVYVLDGLRVLKLAAGASAPEELPFAGLRRPQGLTVDAAGAVYVADSDNKRVLKLAAGEQEPQQLPFTNLQYPSAIAVDASGVVCVVDAGSVVMMAAGSVDQKPIEFEKARRVSSVAFGPDGSIYAAAESTSGWTVVNAAYK